MTSNKLSREARAYTWNVEQRRMGRADARAKRPAIYSDAAYQRGYVEGLAPCHCANSTAHPAGCQRRPKARSNKLCDFCRAGHIEQL